METRPGFSASATHLFSAKQPTTNPVVSFCLLLVTMMICLAPLLLQAADIEPHNIVNPAPSTGLLHIPRIDRAPQLEEFLEMRPTAEWAGKLAQVDGFIQR